MSRNAPEWFGGGSATFSNTISPTKSKNSSRSKKKKEHRRRRSGDRNIDSREESSQKSKKGKSSKKQNSDQGRPQSAPPASHSENEQKQPGFAERFFVSLQKAVTAPPVKQQESSNEFATDVEKIPLYKTPSDEYDTNEPIVTPDTTPPSDYYSSIQTLVDNSREENGAHYYERPFTNVPKEEQLPLQQAHSGPSPSVSSPSRMNTHIHYPGDHELSYSDEDVSAANFRQTYQPSQPLMQTTSHSLYPEYSPSDQLQGNENYQIRQQHQMIALAKQSNSIRASSLPEYGSISGVGLHNDMYISEEGSITSAYSSGSYDNHHLYSSKKGMHSEFPTLEEETRGDIFPPEPDDEEDIGLEEMLKKVNTSMRSTTEQYQRPHVSNMHRSGRQSNDEKSNTSGRSEHNNSPLQATIQPSTLPNNCSTSTSSHGSKSNLSATKSNATNNSQTRLKTQSPPPVPSIRVEIKSANPNSGSGSSASQSPRLQQQHNGLPQNPQLSQRMNKKEKRQRRKKENQQKIEDHVQAIIREGHIDALDWSCHVPQEVLGMNRAAGFFHNKVSRPAQDVPFALLFFIQFCAIFYIALQYGGFTILEPTTSEPAPPVVENNDAFLDPFSSTPISQVSREPMWSDIQVDYNSALQLACISALYATSFAALMIGVMMILSNAVIQTFLFITVIACFSFGAIGIALSPYDIIPVLGLILLALSIGYCIVVWDHVPFATTNMNVALNGTKCSADLLVVAFGMMMVAFVWTIVWTVSFVSVYDEYLTKPNENGIRNSLTWEGFTVCVGMLVSYFWTLNVIMNIVHVTVAGVVGTWWSKPDSLRGCCAYNLREQLGKALTTNLGSICLGSLLVPPAHGLQTLSSICNYSTSSHPISDSSHGFSGKMDSSVSSDMSTVLTNPQRSSPCESISYSCNDFGFIYVGLYGDSFMKGSKKATDIFKARNWHDRVSDQLIPHILMIATIIISLITGIFALVVEEYDGFQLTNFRERSTTAFLIGSYIGLVLSMVCLKVVGSSVNTVLVCFSIAPYAFRTNHPGLSNDMRDAWGGEWFDFDLDVA